MQAKQAEFSRGFSWVTEGFSAIKSQFGMIFLMFILFIVFAIVISLIPIVGAILLYLVMPGITAGFYYSIHKIQRGEKVALADITYPLTKDKEAQGSLLILGVLSMVFGIIFMLTISASVMGAVFMSQSADASHASLFGLPLIFGLLAWFAYTSAFFYAPQLVIFGRQGAMSALKASFLAVLTNFLPLILLGIVVFILGIIALIPFGLGWLFLAPVLYGVGYVSYRDVFCITDLPTAPVVPPSAPQPGTLPPSI